MDETERHSASTGEIVPLGADAVSGDVRPARLRLTIGAGVVLVLLAAVIAVIVSLFASHGVQKSVTRAPGVHSVTPAASAGPASFVHVVGAVRHPGLYSLASGDRVVDAIAAAGGFSPKADQTGLNLARPLIDGEQLIVPVRSTRGGASGTAPASSGAPAGGAGPTMLSLNSADLTALETLDGIGPALAQRIVDYRQAHGGFRAVTDLQNVSGIGDKKFAAIKDHVTL